MTTKRKPLYKARIIDFNKELDYLDSKIHNMDFKNYSYYTIPQFVEFRSDLISFVNYNTVDLWWLICEFNDIDDPFTQLVMGRILKIPSLTEYYRFYNASSIVDDVTEKFGSRPL